MLVAKRTKELKRTQK